MVEIEKLAKYPFLEEAKKYVKENNLSVGEILGDPVYERARMRGIERLYNSLKKKRDSGDRSIATENDCIMELLSYPIARMVAVCVGDKYFKRRYALAEAIHFYKNLIKEKTSFIVDIAEEFDFDINYEKDTKEIRIHFTDYLNNAPTRYKKWKMVNRELNNGYVIVSKKDLVRLIQEAIRERINKELDERECSDIIYKTFSTDINRIKNKVSIKRKKIEKMPIGKLDITKLPPCMKDILSNIQSGENVPHMGRFALVAFLNSLKLSTNEILKLFSSAPDYEEERTRYQVEHITGDVSGTSYTPPGCEKMKTYGLCPTEKIDDLCKKKNHPLSYYKAKWKKNKKKDKKKRK